MKRCLIIFAILLNVVGLFSQDKPNVVVWFLDNLAIGDVGYNNSEISTPNFDAFVQNDGAVNLSNFRNTNGLCSPSRAAILTGRPACEVGMFLTGPQTQSEILTEELTLAEILKSQGYRTGVFGKWHLSQLLASPGVYDTEKYGFDHAYTRVGVVNGQIESSESMWRRGIPQQWLDTVVNKPDPFFLFFAVPEPHPIVHPVHGDPGGQWTYHDPAYGGTLSGPNDFRSQYIGSEQLPNNYGYSQNPALDTNFVDYAATISAADWAFGEFIQYLKDAGEYDNTIIILSSDNGGLQAASVTATNLIPNQGINLSGNLGKVYDGSLRVPTAIRWGNGNWTNRTVTTLASHYDLMPTLAAVVGSTNPLAYQGCGEDISEILSGQTTIRQKGLYVETISGGSRINGGGSTPRPAGGFWPNGRTGRNTMYQNELAFVNAAGTKKIVAGFFPYQLDMGEPLDWRRVQTVDPRSWQFYDLTVDPLEEFDLYDTVTGADLLEFQAMQREMLLNVKNTARRMPMRSWINKAQNLVGVPSTN